MFRYLAPLCGLVTLALLGGPAPALSDDFYQCDESRTVQIWPTRTDTANFTAAELSPAPDNQGSVLRCLYSYYSGLSGLMTTEYQIEIVEPYESCARPEGGGYSLVFNTWLVRGFLCSGTAASRRYHQNTLIMGLCYDVETGQEFASYRASEVDICLGTTGQIGPDPSGFTDREYVYFRYASVNTASGTRLAVPVREVFRGSDGRFYNTAVGATYEKCKNVPTGSLVLGVIIDRGAFRASLSFFTDFCIWTARGNLVIMRIRNTAPVWYSGWRYQTSADFEIFPPMLDIPIVRPVLPRPQLPWP